MFWFIIIGAFILTGMISLMFMLRVQYVSDYRLSLIDQISVHAKVDIYNDRPWAWRYDEFEYVTFNEMVFCFWKPVEWFYPDKSFVRPADNN